MGTPTQVFAYHKMIIENVIRKEVSDYLVQLLKEKINDTVYSNPEGDYERTYAMYNAVRTEIKGSGNEFLIDLFSDEALMTYMYPSYNDSESDNRDSIVTWLNDGTNGSPYFNHPNHEFLEKTAKEIYKNLNMFFIRTLRGYGINAKSRGNTSF